MKRLVRRIEVWALISESKTIRTARVLLWWLPWIVIVTLALWYMPFLPAAVLCSIVALAGVGVWTLGFIHARRKNIHNMAEVICAWSGEHPDIVEMEMKEGLKARARR
jgi:DMSO reductase anchor subunit